MKDIALLLIGFLLGIFGSMIATIIMNPVIEKLSGFATIRRLSGLLPSFLRDKRLDVGWRQTWTVNEAGVQNSYSSDIKIFRFLNLVACEFTYPAKNGATVTAHIVGQFEVGRFLVGRWFNMADTQGYRGALQLQRSGDGQRFEGVWVGLSDGGGIKSGLWYWERHNNDPQGERTV